ncbi:TetR family transcriptional regulator [Lacticaseibacillus baoqingensis]|uniref:TetR family transcriptional regulator n=1 Tax=Lacticaseibacillus baoqingensis TaxID=2486013 RepID=A0ABW4E5K7_9LACO|nr:TetR family transcriptional regulator [Lacticaseibacillus baoqingensis]
MPKPTFFRLPDEKRQRLVTAAYAEFTRAPFAEASISNIIKDAGIPRGSFYQYFEDKSDVFFYLLDRMRQSTKTWMKDTIDAQAGDFYAAIAEVFDHVINDLVDGPYAPFYRNVFMYMDFHSASKMSPVHPPKPPQGKGELVGYLVAHVDRSRLLLQSDEDLQLLIRMVMGLFMQTLGYYYNRLSQGEQIPITELKRRLAQELEWLQHGTVKKEEQHD